jgi:radical SAM superfamily enzyme YgiQ (UPF0313 family)
MRILFIVPPYRTTDALIARLYPQPYAAVILGTILKGKGHEVTIKDFLLPPNKSHAEKPASFAGGYAPPYFHYGETMENVYSWLAENVGQYDAVGLCMGQCNVYETGTLIAQWLHKLRVPLVVGGPFASTAPSQVAKLTGADCIVVREGEEVVEEAFEVAIKKSHLQTLFQAEYPYDITKIPVPDWSLAPPENYPMVNGKYRGVLTISRGCPWACSFCSVHTIMSRHHRRQSKERIIEELENLFRWDVRYFSFLDDNLFISEKDTNDVLDAIDEWRQINPKAKHTKFYVEEGIEVRIAAIPGLVKRIHDTGFVTISLGLETINAQTRADIKKPFVDEHLKSALVEFKKANVTPRAFYIVGFPNDTLASVCRDLVEFGKLGMSVRANNLKVYPGTDLTKDYIEKGFIKEDYDWRMSSWHTPRSNTLTYKQIRVLKNVLRAIGEAAEEFDVALFGDSLEEIKEKIGRKKHELIYNREEVTIKGHMFRLAPYKMMAELLLLRLGRDGAESAEISKSEVKAVGLSKPKDEIQDAITDALIGVVRTKEKLSKQWVLL